jgi:isopenicillin-N epimerase
MSSLKDQFLLDPNVVFLNHGSFGATPRPVFDAYQAWQRELERQPVQFMARNLNDRLAEARRVLADYLHGHADDLVYVPNATFGVNMVARSLALGPGDEILTTDHEYGACDKIWQFVCGKTGASYLRRPIPLPVTSPEAVAEQLWQGVTPRTRVIFLSHVTSPTALRMPVEAICRRARQAGILTLIDGAHAPGQIPLALEAIGADFYTGNCHKWLLSPKGAAFLHVRRDRQRLIEPLVVSWGWQGDPTFEAGAAFPDSVQWMGTKDPAAYLSVPAAIQFQAEHDWPAVVEGCHALVRQALHRIGELTHLAPPYPDDAGFYRQMAAAPLPPIADPAGFQARLYDEYRIEIPLIEWQQQPLIRISVQGYNSQADIDALLEALALLLPQVAAARPSHRP